MASWIGPALVAAIVSSIVTVLGWFVAHQKDVRTEARRRKERVIDIQAALRAEIRTRRHRLTTFDLPAHAERLVAAMASDETFTPFVPSDAGTFVFTAVVQDIHILPTDVIDPIVLYYQQAESIARFVDDLRSERYAKLGNNRKIEMYRDYTAMISYAIVLADQAIETLDRSLVGNGVRLSSQASARSDQRSGGVARAGEDQKP